MSTDFRNYKTAEECDAEFSRIVKDCELDIRVESQSALSTGLYLYREGRTLILTGTYLPKTALTDILFGVEED